MSDTVKKYISSIKEINMQFGSSILLSIIRIFVVLFRSDKLNLAINNVYVSIKKNLCKFMIKYWWSGIFQNVSLWYSSIIKTFMCEISTLWWCYVTRRSYGICTSCLGCFLLTTWWIKTVQSFSQSDKLKMFWINECLANFQTWIDKTNKAQDLLLVWKFVRRTKGSERKIVNVQIFRKAANLGLIRQK